MIDTIIFDLGGVVVFETPDLWKSIFLDISNEFNINFETLESHIKRYKSDIQIGKIKLSDFYQEVLNSVQRNDLKLEELLQAHLKTYTKYSGKYDNEMLSLISHLRQSYHVVCFTNTEPEIAELNRRRGLFDYFEKAFISSEMGLRKPDPRSYQMVLNELLIEPQQAIFVDNDPDYVQIAKELGINGILYQGMNLLKQELVSLGVNINR